MYTYIRHVLAAVGVAEVEHAGDSAHHIGQRGGAHGEDLACVGLMKMIDNISDTPIGTTRRTSPTAYPRSPS